MRRNESRRKQSDGLTHTGSASPEDVLRSCGRDVSTNVNWSDGSQDQGIAMCLDAGITALQSNSIQSRRSWHCKASVPKRLKLFEMFIENVLAPFGHVDQH